MAPTVYSFKSLVGVFAHPFIEPYVFRGQQGIGSLSITRATDRTAHDTAADGAIMVSYISGNSGTVAIETQQTSDIHRRLLAWYNACVAAAELGDPSLWASATLDARSIADGATYIITGISPGKVPDQPYQSQGQKITWSLMAADVQAL